MLKPVFAVGFLAAAWTQERGGDARASRSCSAAFARNLWALLPLGVVLRRRHARSRCAATALVDGGKLLALLSGTEPRLDEARSLAERASRRWLCCSSAPCALPTLLALWFAPALVVFQDAGARTALRTSSRAALANWRPIVRLRDCSFSVFGGVVPR